MPKRTIDLTAFKIEISEDKLVGDLNEAKAMVWEARAKLAQVVAWGITKKDQPRFKLCMQTYFRVPSNAPDEIYNTAARSVMDNLRELNPQVQSFDLMLSPVVASDETTDAAAYVQRSIPDYVYDATIGPNPGTRANFYGPLFLRFESLFPVGTAAANLVHEATHRFLGTRDWAYVVHYDMIDYEKTFRDMGLAPPAPPKSVNSIKAWYDMSVPEAVNNADSYAGFVMHLTCT